MTCRELIDLLAAYVDGEVPPDQLAALEEHLDTCPFCRNYLDSYRKTIELEKTAFSQPELSSDERIPPELLHAVLAARRKHSKS